MKVTAQEKKKYELRTRADFEILAGCKSLEKVGLKKSDKDTVKLIKSQLLKKWRKPLLQKLNDLIREYRSKSK